ncbi:MAG TPA: hypothetical protein VF311_13495, partial [Terriglobales bacterium]
RLNPPDLRAEYLDERTRGIPGRPAELQQLHILLMPSPTFALRGHFPGSPRRKSIVYIVKFQKTPG